MRRNFLFLLVFILILAVLVYIYLRFDLNKPSIFLSITPQTSEVEVQERIHLWRNIVEQRKESVDEDADHHFLAAGRFLYMRQDSEGLVYLSLLQERKIVHYLLGPKSVLQTVEVPVTEQDGVALFDFSSLTYQVSDFDDLRNKIHFFEPVMIEFFLPSTQDQIEVYRSGITSCENDECRGFYDFSLNSLTSSSLIFSNQKISTIISPDAKIIFATRE